MTVSLNVRLARWPIAGSFTIARGSRTEVRTVIAEISEGKATGRGECVPYARYGVTVEAVADTISDLADDLRNGLDRSALQQRLEPGAARNAVDCALWDVEAKRGGRRVIDMLGMDTAGPLTTAYTLSLDTADRMADAARAVADRALLKVKLGQPGDPERIAAIRAAAPKTRLIVDANEGWTADTLADNLAACAEAGVTLVEQPLPAGDDTALDGIDPATLVCADESVHGLESFDALEGRYGAINIKLDKTGGLTEALALKKKAQAAGMKIMVGCMLASSLAMAPAVLLAQDADVVDLDGPLLLAEDCAPALRYEGSLVYPPEPALWG